jgi:hypothetical protein
LSHDFFKFCFIFFIFHFFFHISFIIIFFPFSKNSKCNSILFALSQLKLIFLPDNMGLNSTQTLATFFDGVARHTPEGIAFKDRVEKVGLKQAVAERDRPKAKL